MSIKRLPKKVVVNWFWKQVNAYINPECYAPGTYSKPVYLELYAVMYDNGWLSEDDLYFLDYERLPEE